MELQVAQTMEYGDRQTDKQYMYGMCSDLHLPLFGFGFDWFRHLEKAQRGTSDDSKSAYTTHFIVGWFVVFGLEN